MKRARLQMAGAVWSAVCAVALSLSLVDNLAHGGRAMALFTACALVLQLGLLVSFVCGMVHALRLERQAAAADARSLMLHRARHVIWRDRRFTGRPT